MIILCSIHIRNTVYHFVHFRVLDLHAIFFDQLGVKGDVALRRKNGALSVEASSMSLQGDFIQARDYKARFVYM